MKDIKTNITGVSETLFLTLYSRAMESKTKDPIVKDVKSEEIVEQLDKILSKSDSKLHQMLLERKLPKDYITLIALRTKKFDEYISEFLSKNPNGIIVNLGCGLDTGFYRNDNEKVDWYDIDLPNVIELKKQLLNEDNRYHLISSSILDFAWMKNLPQNRGRPFLFLMEGVTQYLHENEIKSIILNLQKNFSGCELVFSVISKFVIKLNNIGLLYFSKSELNVSKDINYSFGIYKSDQFTSLNSGIEFLDDCIIYDTDIKKIRLLKLYQLLEKIIKFRRIVHYRLN